jgi:hypothetical protein
VCPFAIIPEMCQTGFFLKSMPRFKDALSGLGQYLIEQHMLNINLNQTTRLPMDARKALAIYYYSLWPELTHRTDEWFMLVFFVLFIGCAPFVAMVLARNQFIKARSEV